jgi:O-antigen ligase
LIVWVIPRLLQRHPLPALSGPLFTFVGVAVLASAASMFLELYPFLGQDVPGRSLRALVTLGVGLTFYLTAASYPTTEGKLRASMRWLAAGAVAMLIWSTLQAALLRGDEPIPWQLRDFHRLFSVRDLNANRVTGFAFEPSWLSDQLVVLYLPLWMGAILAGFSAFPRLAGRLPLEALLFGWGLIVLILTKSRIGILSALAVAAILGVAAIWRLGGRLLRPSGEGRIAGALRRRAFAVGLRLFLMAALLGLLIAGVYLMGKVDARVARVFTVRPAQLSGGLPALYYYANQLAYAERVMYWVSGIKAFVLHPLLGVGPGNSGFLFRETVPVFGYSLPEITTILSGAPQFPNPKSLWIRLLAETGVVGFLVFILWLIMTGLGAARLARSSAVIMRVIGLGALLALGTQVFEGFSLDTFALPQLWIVLGLVAAGLSTSPGGPNRSVREEGAGPARPA